MPFIGVLSPTSEEPLKKKHWEKQPLILPECASSRISESYTCIFWYFYEHISLTYIQSPEAYLNFIITTIWPKLTLTRPLKVPYTFFTLRFLHHSSTDPGRMNKWSVKKGQCGTTKKTVWKDQTRSHGVPLPVSVVRQILLVYCRSGICWRSTAWALNLGVKGVMVKSLGKLLSRCSISWPNPNCNFEVGGQLKRKRC